MNNLRGLFVFCITNFLERFGFYAMMSVLVLSFCEQRGVTPDEAGVYYSFFYVSIIVSYLIMGLVGDLFNRRKVVQVGLVVTAIGFFLYSVLPKKDETFLIISGIILVLGMGAFKTNLQVQVGDLYKNNFKNGAIGYLIFFASMNLGAVFAPFASLYLRKMYGLDSVFIFSGGVTALAFVLYYFFPVSTTTEQDSTKQRAIYADDAMGAPAYAPVNDGPHRSGYGIDKLFGLIFLILLVPFAWIALHQSGLTYTYFVREFVNLNGNNIETVQALNPFASITFSIIGLAFIYFLLRMKTIHTIFPIIGIGMIVMALGYCIPAFGLTNLSGKLSYSYAVIPMIIFAIGEVFISPFVILGFYHFSHAKVRGLFMGFYMLITALVNSLLFLYAFDYDKYGAEYTFKKIVIHVLICAAAVFLVWFFIKRLSGIKNQEVMK